MLKYFVPPTLVSGLLLIGCAGSFEYKPRTLSGTKWEASNVTVAIEDKRAAASTELPNVPSFSVGGGQAEDMRLPPEFSEFVRRRVAELVSGHGPRLRLLIVPEKVRASWHAASLSETEQASVLLRFRITNEDGSHVLFDEIGSSRQEFSSGDSTGKEFAKLFRAACNDAFDSFFASAANVQRLNAPPTVDPTTDASKFGPADDPADINAP